MRLPLQDSCRPNCLRAFTSECVLSGTVGALAMMPAGFLFRLLEMRVGHYGPKFAALYAEAPGPLLLFAQHFVIGWISAVPICLIPVQRGSIALASTVGATYGMIYYIVVNALALPIYFGDPLPSALGMAVVVPSLVVHVVFGVAVAVAIRRMRV